MMPQNFFDRGPAKQALRHGAKRCYIDIGGEQFHALAVAFIDAIKTATRVPEVKLKTILEKIYSDYPKYKSGSNSAFLTSLERIKMLFNSNSIRKSEMVDCLADVLRGLVSSEVRASPLKYREIFDGLDKNTSKEELRFTSASIFGLAVSQALGINLTLSYIEPNKELRKREVYNYNEKNGSPLEITLQAKGALYFPQVKNIKDFAYVGQLPVKPSKPLKSMESASENLDDLKDLDISSETLGEMIALVDADNQRILRIYTQWCQNLLTMVQLDELKTEDLRDLYIEFLPLENGAIDPGAFLINASDKESQPIELKVSIKLAEEFEQLCAEALAGWISMELVDVEQFSDRLEQLSSRSASLAI